MSEKTSHKKDAKALKRRRAEELEELEVEELEEEEPEEEIDEEELEDEDDEARRSRRKKGFPVGGLILMFLLIGVILAAGYFGMEYMEQYTALKADYDGRVAAAEAELQAAQSEYAEADPESEAHAAERQQLTDEMIAAAQAELDGIRAAEDEADSAIETAESRMKELEDVEDFDYYKAIYDEYVEGRAYVEDLLSGD